MAREDYLFTGPDWHSVDRHQRQQMAAEIEKVDSDRLLNTSVDDLALYFSEKYKIGVPVLDEENLVVDQREKQIDVSRDPNRYITDRSRPFYITGSEIEVEIPFTGEAEAFKIQPNPYTLSPPRASVRDNLLTFTIVGTNLEATQVRGEIERTLREIQSYLTNLRANVASLNGQLQGEAHNVIEARRNKLLANRNTVASLGFKMKERQSSPKTYVPPDVRKKISPIMPPASSAPYKPEPALGQTDYEHILGVMQSMTQVMELSPSAFHDVDEEALRSHFLVQLNGHYQGQATGETFNYEGKTDILIRSEGRNIFIAECKFWAGPKKLTETIDQLLGYSSWRDTKTSVVVFNRNRDFSKVLAAIPDAVRAHPQYKKDLPGSTETVFRYLFANRDDRNRELYLTVMAFDVPTLRP
ncbi:hypothetical protein K8B33_07030 [Alcanivorax sp. JB21]|uniref:hypothetical protein n=1 Tax=Alcanivorax limicola TaxID=2874102 RepID=UPI001CBDFB9F|nr:hypothetical protein [Alcanivorax limicola]MBZ2188843.1 hypothetical protein [Alcanivorax limicola]